MAKQRRASEHAEQRQEIDRAGQDQPWPSALCREAEQERGRDQRQQQPERVDAAVEFEFPIGVVGLPARETHVRLNALCPGSSSTFGLGEARRSRRTSYGSSSRRAAPVVIAAVGNARPTPATADVIEQDVDSAIGRDRDLDQAGCAVGTCRHPQRAILSTRSSSAPTGCCMFRNERPP